MTFAVRPRPWLGILAVLCGAFISTLTSRLTAFGLADIRGGVHAGFDEGSWIATAHTVGQMLVTPIAVWAGGVYGPRRVLMWGCAVFGVAEALAPLSGSLQVLLLMQFVAGLGTGTFIPMTLPVVLRTLDPRHWAWGIAAYALNLELSLNIAASLEAWHIDHGGWRMIFWQNVPLAALMFACVRAGLPRQPWPGHTRWPSPWGVVCGGLGLAPIYAGLDQGNRLDWFSSGIVMGLLGSGAILVAAAAARLRVIGSTWFRLDRATEWPLLLLLLLVLVLRLTILSTAYLIPQFLMTVRGYRTFEVGEALVWIAIPQLLTATVAALLLRRVDSRLTASLGLVAIAVACVSVGTGLTALWGPQQFLATQLLQSLGQTLALSGIVYTSVQHMRPDAALTFGGMIQTARLLGGEVGLAATATFVRVREQHASNLLGQHVTRGDALTTERLHDYAVAVSGTSDDAASLSLALLGRTVRQAADLQSCIDGFLSLAAIACTALLILLVVGRAPHGPAAPRPFRWRTVRA